MPRGMARKILSLTLGSAVMAVALGLGSAAIGTDAASAQAAAVAGCDVELTPSSRTVRRGGKVLLRGEACGAAASSERVAVRVKLRKNKRRWATVAKAETDASGQFTVCARVRVSRKTRVARLQATAPGGQGSTAVRVTRKGPSGCKQPGGGNGGGNGGGGGYEPPKPDNPDPNCPLADPSAQIGMTVPSSCSVVAQDTAANPDPTPFWGRLDCASDSRHQRIATGGDAALTASGAAQPDQAFRRIRVIDGDDVWGERCEMGFNWHQASDPGYGIKGPGPTVLYHEGQRRVTYISIRLGANWDVNDPDWRTVYQNKQAQPYDNPTMASMFEMQVRSGSWTIISDWSEPLFEAPAKAGVWTRFAFDITYSQDPNKGRIKVYVDLNGDGDATDAGEQSPVIRRPTLLRETAGPNGDVGAGNSIPSHLRAGVYHAQSYSCPPPNGCHADFDNVQVVKG
jgi:hypothetical protein